MESLAGYGLRWQFHHSYIYDKENPFSQGWVSGSRQYYTQAQKYVA